jgi:glycosyltransferase involved in cell wall biosynthesis
VDDHESRGLSRRALAAALGCADAALVASEGEAEVARALAPRTPARVYRPLPARGLLPPPAEPREAIRARLGLARPTVLSLGFVRPYKGIATLIRAVALAAKEVDLDLVVAGESWGGEGARLAAVAREAGIADRVDFQDRYLPGREAADLLHAADIVALAYDRAGHSAVAGLAVEHGRPLLATRTGALPAFVEDGASGYLVAPGDAPAIARALVDFVANRRHDAMAAAARARASRLARDAADDILAAARHLV